MRRIFWFICILKSKTKRFIVTVKKNCRAKCGGKEHIMAMNNAVKMNTVNTASVMGSSYYFSFTKARFFAGLFAVHHNCICPEHR